MPAPIKTSILASCCGHRPTGAERRLHGTATARKRRPNCCRPIKAGQVRCLYALLLARPSLAATRGSATLDLRLSEDARTALRERLLARQAPACVCAGGRYRHLDSTVQRSSGHRCGALRRSLLPSLPWSCGINLHTVFSQEVTHQPPHHLGRCRVLRMAESLERFLTRRVDQHREPGCLVYRRLPHVNQIIMAI